MSIQHLHFFTCMLHAQPITLIFQTPKPNQVITDSLLKVSIYVHSSVYEITSVVARVGDRQVPLKYTSSNIFTGYMSLTGLPQNVPLDVHVTAIDGGGNTDSAATSFSYSYDPVPSLIVDYPIAGDNANPMIRVKANCIDNGPCTLNVRAYVSTIESYHLFLNKNFNNAIDSSFDLSGGEGKPVYLVFNASDSRGQTAIDTVLISVESSPLITKIYTCPANSILIQFNYNKVLVYNDSVITITDITTGESKNISGGAPILTKYGALFYQYTKGGQNNFLQELYNDKLDTLGPSAYRSNLQVAEDFASWTDLSALYLRNLQTRTNDTITNIDTGILGISISGDGDAVYPKSAGLNLGYDIVRYKDHVATAITNDGGSGIYNSAPFTDGIDILYSKRNPKATNPLTYLYLFDGTSNKLLTGNSGSSLLNNKWVAYTRPSATQVFQAWLRDSAGNQTQKSFFNDDSKVETLDDKGNFTFIVGSFIDYKRYFSSRDSSQPIFLGSNTGYTCYRDSSWYWVLGRNVYRIDLVPRQYFSVANGNWDSPATWVGNAVPPPNANVEIRNNIVCNISTTCNSLKITRGGLTIATGLVLKVLH